MFYGFMLWSFFQYLYFKELFNYVLRKYKLYIKNTYSIWSLIQTLRIFVFSGRKLQCPDASDAELAEVLKDTDSPLLKTHNKEIASILRNMRQLENTG